MPATFRFLILLNVWMSCVSIASAQPVSSPSPDAHEFVHESAASQEARASEHPYWLSVAEALLQGQGRPEQCPRSANANQCLLAARLLLVSRPRSPEEQSESSEASAMTARIAGLARDAAALDPRDPQLQWTLAKGVFREFAPELQAPAIKALRAREPDNLQVWLLASDLEDWDAQRLAAAAAAARSDSYRYDFMRADLGVLAPFAAEAPALGGIDWGATGVETQQVHLIGIATAEWMPGIRGLMQACQTSAENGSTQGQQACWRIAELLVERSDSLMDFGLGVSLMRISAATPAQRERVGSARREYEWIRDSSVELQQMPDGAQAYLRRLREPGADELSAAREAIREAGLPTSPPLQESDDPS